MFLYQIMARELRWSFRGGFIPLSRTYPPSGSNLTPYSVSPRLMPQIFGPKPIMYLGTLTPNFLAGHM